MLVLLALLALLAPGGGLGGLGSAVARATAQAPHTSRAVAVGEIVARYTDPTRSVRFRGRRPERRPLVTEIRYPASGPATPADVLGARPARSRGPYPLIVFAHGFAVTPAVYAPLLRAWTRAGYVVAAPVFPLTNAGTPGGPDESDLINQPADMSVEITRLLHAGASPRGILSGLIDPRRIAVAGQSDGGSTALAVSYNSRVADPRIRAAAILSGALIPGLQGYRLAPGRPPLLAVQGTADVINAPRSTYAYFRRARSPKFLLSLLGARHLGPYTNQEPQLGIVERESVAFFDRYLKDRPGTRARMWSAGDVSGVATLSAGG